MLIIPPSEYRPRRGQRKPRAAETPAALAVAGIIDLNFGGDVLSFTVVFNTTPADPLEDPISADPTKWTARYNGALFEAGGLTLLQYDQINIGLSVIGAEAGPNVVNYSNAPSDISDSLGRQLAAFGGFPLP